MQNHPHSWSICPAVLPLKCSALNETLKRDVKIFLFLLCSPDVALPSVSAYDNEDQMLTFVKSQLKEIAKRKGN